jgi:hypothetical protein
MQYSIRNIPDYLDGALRETARKEGKSLNEVALDALTRGAGLGERQLRRRDLTGIAGSWQEDASFDNAVAAQDQVDEAIWR